MDTLIIVASHPGVPVDVLLPPYLVVFRTDEPSTAYRDCIGEIPGIESATITWSEYPQFLYAFPLPLTLKIFGFQHYRCMLDLKEQFSHLQMIPFYMRKEFAVEQAKIIDTFAGKIVVGIPWSFDVSAWDQFVRCHPDLETVLSSACSWFDDTFGECFSSEHVLKSNNFLYCRNIFIAPPLFATKWKDFAFATMKYLDTLRPITTEKRWGGLILERLFSVYLSHKMTSLEYDFVFRPLVFFI